MTTLPTSSPNPPPAPPVTSPFYTAQEVNERIRTLAVNRLGTPEVGNSVRTGIEFFDSRNAPMIRGTMSAIVGQTNHGKSPLAATIIRNVTDALKLKGSAGSVVVFMTEETVETREIQLWNDSRVSLRQVLNGNARLDVIDQNITKSNADPIYFIGDSADLATVDMSDETFGALTPTRIGKTLQKMIRMGIQPELVVIDHIHDLQLEKPPRNEMEVYETIGRQLVALGIALKPYCPVLYVCQAKKDVSDRPSGLQRVPEVEDIKYMSALIHKVSHGYSVSYPKKYMSGQKVKTAQGEYEASTGLFLVKSAKFRYGDSGDVCAMTSLDESGNWAGLLRELKTATPMPRPSRRAGDAD